jgi:hypothetical protein
MARARPRVIGNSASRVVLWCVHNVHRTWNLHQMFQIRAHATWVRFGHATRITVALRVMLRG